MSDARAHACNTWPLSSDIVYHAPESIDMEHSRVSPATHLPEAAVIAAGILLWTAPAYAYLDPATGSILLQGLLAGVAGLVVVLRLYWGRLTAFFRKWTGRA